MKAQETSKPVCWPLPHAVKPFIECQPGLLLCGDGGCFIDPFTGEGIWQALHSGKLAGIMVTKALQDKDGALDTRMGKSVSGCLQKGYWTSICFTACVAKNDAGCHEVPSVSFVYRAKNAAMGLW